MRRFFMSRSEFRYNKKRKHYAYLFKDLGELRKNILLTTKSIRIAHGKRKKNILLFKSPNNNENMVTYVIPYVYIDHLSCFDSRVLLWVFDRNDKRKIKRIKKRKIKKIKSQFRAPTLIRSAYPLTIIIKT